MPPSISIVSTLYRSSAYLHEFHRRVTAAVTQITSNYEILFVNDGCPEDSIDVALNLYAEDEHVRVIDLAQNYQHLKAMMRGIAEAKGELVFLIDCDLEEEPELLVGFYRKMREEKVDVVYGVQADRKGGILERLTGSAFYSVVNFFSDIEIPRNLITARLMTKDYVRGLTQHREREIYLGGLFALTGFKQLPVTVKKLSTSPTTYSTRAKMVDAVNAITSFSNKPLVFIFYLGVLMLSLTGPYLLYLVGGYFFYDVRLEGWTSLIVSVWFLGGLIIFLLGIIGIYLSKIFIETKSRPYTLVRQTWERQTKEMDSPDHRVASDHQYE